MNMRIQGFTGEYKPFLAPEKDGRQDKPDLLPLLINTGTERRHILRQITDLNGVPITDKVDFERRAEALRHMLEFAPTAPYNPVFVEGVGGFVVTELIHGKTLTGALHSLYQGGKKIDGRVESGLVRPVNNMVTGVTVYSGRQIQSGAPVVVDVLKSDQWMLGPNSEEKKNILQLVDHDMFTIFPENGQYDEVARMHILRQALIKAANIGVFLSNLSKMPQIDRPFMFKEALDSVDRFADVVSGSTLFLDSFEVSIVKNVKDILREARSSKGVNNRMVLELGGVDMVAHNELANRLGESD